MVNRSTATRVKVAIGIAAGLLAGALSLSAARADQAKAPKADSSMGGPSAERTTSETVVVTGIDRSTRSVTVQNADGDKRTVQVPSDVKAFDTMKVGDKIDIDYYEAMAVSMLPPGSKPTMTQRTAGGRLGDGAGVGRETTVSAEIISVDAAANKVTFKGPRGQTKTVAVSDPAMQKKLPSLKPGQVVQFTYTEAIAASIRPAVSK